MPVMAAAFKFVFCFPCCPFFWGNISLFISCSQEALSQMSTSVVEVWQPEDADPFVPLQVIITPLPCLHQQRPICECVKAIRRFAATCMTTCAGCLLCFFPLPPSLCNPARCTSFTFYFIHTWKSQWLHSNLLLFKWLLISSLCAVTNWKETRAGGHLPCGSSLFSFVHSVHCGVHSVVHTESMSGMSHPDFYSVAPASITTLYLLPVFFLWFCYLMSCGMMPGRI